MKTTINMFQSRKPPRQRAKLSGKSFILPLVVILVVVVMLGAYFLLYTQGRALDAAIQLQTALINQSMETDASSQELQEQVTRYRIYEGQLETAQQVLSAAPEFNRAIFDTIDSVRPANVTIQGLSVADNVVSIYCSTSSNVPPAGFAEALDSLPEFASVGYTGFQESGEGAYSFTLTCVLPPAIGGDAQ